jgi:hypothetical protein
MLRNYSLVWTLLVIILLFGSAGWFYDRHTVAREAERHGETWTTRDVWIEWAGHNADRVMASAILILLYSLVRKYTVLVGSPVSRSEAARREAKLDRIEKAVRGY